MFVYFHQSDEPIFFSQELHFSTLTSIELRGAARHRLSAPSLDPPYVFRPGEVDSLIVCFKQQKQVGEVKGVSLESESLVTFRKVLNLTIELSKSLRRSVKVPAHFGRGLRKSGKIIERLAGILGKQSFDEFTLVLACCAQKTEPQLFTFTATRNPQAAVCIKPKHAAEGRKTRQQVLSQLA